MPTICLIGRHGSGKSTIGKALQEHGYKHISVGTLKRLANNNQFPSDVPYSLMLMIKRAPAGQLLPDDTAAKLIAHARSFRNCVIDGFPASGRHLDMLPGDCVIGYVWAPKSVLPDRLTSRAETSVRKWTPGLKSEREVHLAEVAHRARNRRRVVFIGNNGDRSQIAGIAENFVAKLMA